MPRGGVRNLENHGNTLFGLSWGYLLTQLELENALRPYVLVTKISALGWSLENPESTSMVGHRGHNAVRLGAGYSDYVWSKCWLMHSPYSQSETNFVNALSILLTRSPNSQSESSFINASSKCWLTCYPNSQSETSFVNVSSISMH